MASGFCSAAKLTNCGVHARLVQFGREGGRSRVLKPLVVDTARLGLRTSGCVFIVFNSVGFVLELDQWRISTEPQGTKGLAAGTRGWACIISACAFS